MEYKSIYSELWETIGATNEWPKYFRNIISSPYAEVSESIISQDHDFATDIIQKLYAGDILILKGAFSRELCERTKKDLHAYGQSTPPEFHKMKEGCQNFHRIIDAEVAKNYCFKAIRHSYYFFPWNDDRFNILSETYKVWRVVKLLAGLPPDAYEHNTPKDGIVDRLQVAQYPSGAGLIELHSDPFQVLRLVISGIMSKRGEDYQNGGAYFVDKDNNEVDVEDSFDVGDWVLYIPTMLHGVHPVDPDVAVDWTSGGGRWWFGPFCPSSDQAPVRHVGQVESMGTDSSSAAATGD